MQQEKQEDNGLILLKDWVERTIFLESYGQ